MRPPSPDREPARSPLPHRWFGLLMKAFPPAFRARHDQAMRGAFTDEYDELRTRGLLSAGFFLMRTTMDMAVSGFRERRALAALHRSTGGGRHRSRRANEMLHNIRQDLVYSCRTLVRNPLFSLAAIVTLALGVGATTSMFSLVNGVLLKPLPYQESERLIRVFTEALDEPGEYYVMSKPDLQDVSELPAYDELTGYRSSSDVLTGHGSATLVSTGLVTSGILEVFGLEPFMGRDLRLEESDVGRPNVAVLGHGFWETVLGADPDVLGKSLELQGERFEIIGVAPKGFDFPNGSQLWRPFVIDPAVCGRSCHSYNVLARRSESATLEQAKEQTHALALRLSEEYLDTNREKRFHVTTLQEHTVGSVKAELWVLLGAVGLVLLVACANVANLLLVRAQGRTTEVGIRAAMGAGRGRLLSQVLTESLVLSTLGAGLGLLLAFGGVGLLKTFSPGDIPRMSEVAIDPRVLLFTLVLTLGVALAFGLSPALGMARSSPAAALRRSGRGTSAGRPSHGTRCILLASEMALSVVLLVGAGLLLRTLHRMHTIEPGYRTENILRFSLTLPKTGYPDGYQVTQFYQELEERMRALPQVASVGSAYRLPLDRPGSSGGVRVEGRPEVPGERPPQASPRPVTPGYLRTMGISVIRGRELLASDNAENIPVALVNETFAAENFPGEDPIGKRLNVTVDFGFGSPTWTIVGIVPDFPSLSLTADPVAEVFVPMTQMASSTMTMAVRSAPDALPLLTALRTEVDAMDPDLPLRFVATMEEVVSGELAPTRFYLFLLAAFACLAVILAAVGLYGVVSYLVSLRRQEVGIRMALGADGRGILHLFLRQAALPVVAGIVAGVGVALASASILEAFLFEVNPRDPLVFGGVVAVLAAVALLATAGPARAAVSISPTEAMRAE